MTLASLGEVVRRYGLDARKSLGQHFLLNPAITTRIAAAAGHLDGVHVIEIGPGPGGLTRALLETSAAEVVAIERDDRCVRALAELAEAYPGRLRVVADDAMTVDPAELAPPPRRIIANLPYNISTALLTLWLARIGDYDGLTLMFQREVALRLCAAPGSKAYGRLSVLTRWLTEPRILFDIPPGAFTPPPQVTSSLVHLSPRAAPLAPAPRDALERVTAAAFGQRRKMLRSSLRSLGVSPEDLLAGAGIEPTRRAEELRVEDFCALARGLESVGR